MLPKVCLIFIFSFLSFLSSHEKKFLFFTSGWQFYFALTLDIGILIGWKSARWNSLRSHLAKFIKNTLVFVEGAGGGYFSLCESTGLCT